MKILYLSGYVIPSRKAHSIHIMRMSQALAQKGHNVILFAYASKQSRDFNLYAFYGTESDFDIELMSVPRVRGGTLLTLPRLRKRLLAHSRNDTLVYARSIYGALVAARLGFRIIYEAHWPPPNAWIHWLEKRLFAKASFQKLVLISKSLEQTYRTCFGEMPCTEVCHDAADIPPDKFSIDYPWPCATDTLQIGYTGHLYAGRGIELILACAARLPHYAFHIVGGLYQDIERWADRGGTNVHFHGYVQPSLVQTVLSKCDVLLMPYQRNVSVGGKSIDTSNWMSPMKLFEYMASRRVIIASDLPVLREILTPENSILVQPESLEEWISAIEDCRDMRYRSRLADAAYQQFLASHTWGQRAEKALSGVGL